MQKFVIFCTPPHETTFENTTLLTGQKSCNILRVGAGIAYLLPSEVTSFVNPLSVVLYSFLLRAGGKHYLGVRYMGECSKAANGSPKPVGWVRFPTVHAI